VGVKAREHPKGSGIWFVFINHHGRRKAKKIGKDKRLANDVAKKIEAKLLLGDLDIDRFNSKCPTFKEYAETWLSLPNDRKDSTSKNYIDAFRRHIYPAFGDIRLDQIKRKDIKLLFDNLLTRGMNSNSFCNIKTPIKSVLDHAVDSELIETNPMSNLKFKRNVRYKVDPLKEEEAFSLLDKAQELESGIYYPPMLCALRTGMRIGEIQALEWEDLDFPSRLIQVSKSYYHKKVTTTKNKRTRQVDMSEKLAETLTRLRLSQKKEALKAGKAVPNRVFAFVGSKVLNRDRFRKTLNACLESAKLRRIRVHDLRHTYATIRLLKGHNIGDVSYQLGHSSISITYDVYGNWIPGKFKSEVDELDAVTKT
jgi:integrase